MEVKEAKCSHGYGKPPWIFKGSALYQLHLVKAETAREFIPKEFRLVEAFGYTLGGFFLANYEDSPAGAFDELVVIAGIVWNPPTSCAWASKVLVSSDAACDHGRKDVGLPSQVAKFSKRITAIPRERKGKFGGFLNVIGLDTILCSPKDSMDVQVTEIDGPSRKYICNINLTTIGPGLKFNRTWKGPAIKMSLPSFSGRTEYNPKLLRYSCNIECRVRAVQPAKVTGSSLGPAEHDKEEACGRHINSKTGSVSEEEVADNQRNLSIAVMLSKPILALELSCLKMKVEAPVEVSSSSNTSHTTPFKFVD